jgi:hypothetical protein
MAYPGPRAAGRLRAALRSPYPQHGSIERAFAFACFTLLLAANAILLSKTAGVPDRSLIAGGMLILCATLYPAELLRVLQRSVLLILVASGLAVLGLLLSFVNGASMRDALQNVVEIHLQTLVLLLGAGTFAQICGARACAIAIVGVIGVSVSVAVMQMMHVGPGWSLRLALGPLWSDDVVGRMINRRPAGLAYSPTQLATQVCLAFATYAAVRDRLRQIETGSRTADMAIILALGVFVGACLASETRAPILGGLIFLVLYAIARRSSSLVLLLALGGFVTFLMWPLLMEMIQDSAPRVLRADDDSAASRVVFAYYGIRLFLDNPIGYGLTFDPTTRWMGYWSDLYLLKGAAGAQVHPLHDYVFSMVNIYGFGLLLFVPFAVKLLRGARDSLIFFVPYITVILFHNAGPFFNDVILWFAVAAVSALPARTPVIATRFGRVPPARLERMRAMRARRMSRLPASSRLAPR